MTISEIANQDTKEFGEHRLDVRYITDTDEVIDIKAEMELDERAKEPIGADGVILKITHAGSFEVEHITNKTLEEVWDFRRAGQIRKRSFYTGILISMAFTS